MTILKKIITILFISILLVACAKPESPSDVVEGYLKDIKKDVIKALNKSDFIIGKDDKELYETLRKALGDFDYTIVNETIEGEKAYVSVVIDTYDIGSALGEAATEYFGQIISMILNGASEDDLQKLLYKLFNEKIDEAIKNGKTYSQMVTVPLKLEDNKWVLFDLENTDLINALLGNLIDIIGSMSNQIDFKED